MPIQRLNHAVLYVRDFDGSVTFYQDVLGFRAVHTIPGRAVFLQAAGSSNDHDLGLFAVGAGAPSPAPGSVGLYHLAWEVDTLAELRRIRARLVEAGALAGQSDHVTTKALYAKDPNGIEFEVSWLLPASLLTPELKEASATLPLDLDAEIERYGAETRGGVGVSVPA